jgi:hypothetical protein
MPSPSRWTVRAEPRCATGNIENAQLGLRLQPVVKGQGSVLEGISKVESLMVATD